MAKIIVLEDDTDIREIIELILTSEDYQVASFASVNEFIQRDVADLPDLFLLDVMLPDGSGVDVCRKLRAEGVYQGIPVIIMSAHASVKQVSAECNADGFIQKPFDLEVFINKIQKALQA